jgi:CxxC motif-containing protein (DUF1111 family)
MIHKKRTFLAAVGTATLALLAVGMVISADTIPEAPAGFDGLTNGFVAQNVFSDAMDAFSETETPDTGIGPTYNDVSCVNCHQNQAVGGAAQSMELRAGHYEGGRQHWTRDSRHRFDTNGSSGTFVAATAILANGTPVPNRSLINQRATCRDAQEHLTDVDNIRAMRLALPIFGDGFVEAVPDATFLALAKQNGGEAIEVPVVELNGVTAIGRFGWKDQHASLLSFSGDAYVNEMGFTNALFPDEAVTGVCTNPNAPEPNDTQDDLHKFADFMRALKVPPRGAITPQVTAGQAIFESLGCNSCHVETMVTAPSGTSILGGSLIVGDAIGGKQFHPFGDFLLHNVGTGDGIVQNGPDDTAQKVRTMPLWGLGTRSQLMHDAQSTTYSEAIERHRGEAADEERRYERLTPAQKSLLYQFLGSL